MRVFFILVSLLVFQNSIVSASVSTMNLGLNPHSPVSEVYTYNEIESPVWVKDSHSGRASWAISKSKVGSESGSTLLNVRNAAKGIGNLKVPVYRVYGGGSGRFGGSWTFVNPKLYGKTYRNFAGLPNANSGRFLIKGKVNLRDINGFRMALPLDGNMGRLAPELLIDNSWNKVIWNPRNITRVGF